MIHESDRKLSPEDLAFITQVRAHATGLGLYLNIYINPIIHNGALVSYAPQASYQKVFAGERNETLMAVIKAYFDGYAIGRHHGSDQGRRGMQSELRSLLGIEEDDGRVYISR